MPGEMGKGGQSWIAASSVVSKEKGKEEKGGGGEKRASDHRKKRLKAFGTPPSPSLSGDKKRKTKKGRQKLCLIRRLSERKARSW